MGTDYEDLFNFSLDILCINGLDGYFKLVNPAFERVLGYTRDEILATHFLEFLHPDDLVATRADMQKRIGGQHTTHFQNRYRSKSGAYVWLEWVSFPVPEKGVMFAVGHDITERKKAEELRLYFEMEKAARMEAEKMVELGNDFISIASHELKTPLTSLTLHVQLLSSMIKDGTLVDLPKETALNLADLAQRQLERLSKLTNDLLKVSRISDGQLRLDLEEAELSQLLQRVVQGFQLEFAKSGCRLEADLEPGLVGRWDKLRLEQVMSSLLTNAMKFGRAKPIRMMTRRVGTMAQLVVEDQGIGISHDDQTKIFERFGRAVSIKSFEGLGLGLYIAHHFITAHGGIIRVESAPGLGAAFIVELPLSL